MRLALISDIHGNLPALQACLAHARAQGADRLALLGDFVGYGAEPGAVVEAVMRLQAEGAWLVRGNHDEMAVQGGAADATLGSQTRAWTHAQLSATQREFLAGLPLMRAEPPLLLVHASAYRPDTWRYVDSERAAAECLAAAPPDTPHVLVGHVHQQAMYYPGRGGAPMKFLPTPGVAVPVPRSRPLVACVGSCGQPRDGDARAMYAVYDLGAARLVFHRVAYNHVAAAAAIRAAGLPAPLADRLEAGR